MWWLYPSIHNGYAKEKKLESCVTLGNTLFVANTLAWMRSSSSSKKSWANRDANMGQSNNEQTAEKFKCFWDLNTKLVAMQIYTHRERERNCIFFVPLQFPHEKHSAFTQKERRGKEHNVNYDWKQRYIFRFTRNAIYIELKHLSLRDNVMLKLNQIQ